MHSFLFKSWKVRFSTKNGPVLGSNLVKIKVYSDKMESCAVKEIWRVVDQEIGAVLALCHLLIFSARGSFARHWLAFSGLPQAS